MAQENQAAGTMNWMMGSIDDPAELYRNARSPVSSNLFMAGGLSLIGPQWRSALSLDISSHREKTAFQLSSILRAGLYGGYEPDSDQRYDFLRAIDYLRYQPRGGSGYLRIGALDRMRLGHGQLVNFLSSQTSWDNRTIGAEARMGGRVLAIEGFTSDVAKAGLTGLRVAVSPFPGSASGWKSMTLGTALVRDFTSTLENGSHFEGFESDFRVRIFNSGGFAFTPFASFARLTSFGQGVQIGADLENANFIDLARIHLRLALQYNSSDFRPGYLGSFYPVSNLAASIGSIGSDASEGTDFTADIRLRDIKRGNAVNTELRILIFERFEFWYQFMRYHGEQRLSEYHLRLFFRSPRLELSVGQDRRGLKGFTSLFSNLGDENRMRFEVDIRLFARVWAQFDAHYTYRELLDHEGRKTFGIQRRFDPLLGIRASF